ncbi:hypothetical protein [Streptomyces daliensis]|uniref:Uncharacterized protein n=1 Tax=Streptomyces daliensis TaxID=299421 RepID=A0A8T4IQ68_9ACTN|nr:hypothetical protein [Streptomyces daliensis]
MKLNGVQLNEWLTSAANDLSPAVKAVGKFKDSVQTYGVGTGIAGLEGLNMVLNEAALAYAIYRKPDEVHEKPSLIRAVGGTLNMTGFGLYGAGSAGSTYMAGAGLMLVTAANVVKQHFTPEREMYYPQSPILPLYERPGQGVAPEPAPLTGVVVVPSTPVPSPAPVTPPPPVARQGSDGQSVAREDARAYLFPARVAAPSGRPVRGRSHSMPDIRALSPEGTPKSLRDNTSATIPAVRPSSSPGPSGARGRAR